MRGIHWFRNDLRLADNTALAELSARVDEWIPLFIIDPRLEGESGAAGPRARFLFDCLDRLGQDLLRRGVALQVREGFPEEVLPKFCDQIGIDVLSFNLDTSPFALGRDARVGRALERIGVRVLAPSDRVVFRSSEIRSLKGDAYSVYSPYRKSWWRRWEDEPRLPLARYRLPGPVDGFSAGALPDRGTPHAGQFSVELPTGGAAAGRRRLDKFLQGAVGRYHEDRDRPGVDGTSRLSPYLRFGAISVRQCFSRALEARADNPSLGEGIEKWLDELIWRDFYAAILEEHPRVLRENYRREYDALVWNDDPDAFAAWCEGQTGFPIVDAGMRQLKSRGWMHNRVRMIVASFLTKDLLIDWRQGERFFFQHLVDGDPASNNGGWQWAASTGTDAQPYFRIFNPTAQGHRWDPEGHYIRRWVPELREVAPEHIHTPYDGAPPVGYPKPMVDHRKRRALALERFRSARAGVEDES